jgi:hypothetical protein
MRKEESEGEIFAPFSIRLSILLLAEICTENVCHIWEDGRAPIISAEPHLFPISTDYCAQKIIQKRTHPNSLLGRGEHRGKEDK